jgi:hypothetical protein
MTHSIGRRAALGAILVPLAGVLTIAVAQPGRGPGMMGGGYHRKAGAGLERVCRYGVRRPGADERPA